MTDGKLGGAVRPELADRAKRVVGVFVFMVGAGIVLDSGARWIGTAIMVVGVTAFIWGIAAPRLRERLAVHEHEGHASAAATHPTEGHL